MRAIRSSVRSVASGYFRRWPLLASVAVLATVAGATQAHAASVTLDFEDFPNETTINTQYQSRGVIFNNNAIASFGPVHSGTNRLDLARSEDEFTFGPIIGSFTRAMKSVSLFAGSIGEAGQTGTLTAFDVSGNVVGRDGPKALDLGLNTPFSVVAGSAQIARFTFEQSPFARPGIDDLTFDDGGGTSTPTDCGITPDEAHLSGCEGTPLVFTKAAPAPVGGVSRDYGANPVPNSDITQVQSALTISITTGIETPGGGGGGTASTDPQEEKACTGSYVDNLRWSYTHTAVDFSLNGKLGDDCPCGGCSTQKPETLPGELKHLEIRRIHRPQHSFVIPSSFGPGAFTQFDTNLRLVNPRDNTPPTAEVYEVDTDSGIVVFNQQTDNTLLDQTRLYKQLEVFDATGTRIPSNSLSAAKAVLTAQTGEKWTFEIINTSCCATDRFGRLVRKEDLNGNAEVISYVFPANADDATLGFDRTRLWQMASVADNYGATATFSYMNLNGRWVLTSIGVPNGQTGAAATITYQYASVPTEALAILSQVNYPDGGVSSFGASIDPTFQEVVLSYNDAGAPAAGSKKSVYVTQSTINDPDFEGGVATQPPNIVRRVINGAGELVYRNWENSGDPNILYIFEAPQKLTRITTAGGYPVEIAHGPGGFNPSTVDPTSVAYDVVESYQVTPTSFMMTGRSRPDGFAKTFTHDPTTRAITGATFPGGAHFTAAYNNAFRKATSIVDLKGDTHTLTYDAKGNMTQATLASGTPAQEIWKHTFNSRGQPLTLTDPNGNVTNYAYDSRGLLTSITQPPDTAGGVRPVTSYGYDAQARVISETDPLGHTKHYAYDLRGRLSTVTYPDGTTETLTFPPNLNAPTAAKDRNNVVTAIVYDGTGRPTSVTKASQRPEAVTTTYAYLPGTRLTQIQNDGGEQVVFGFDRRNRVVSATRRNAFGVDRVRLTAYDNFSRKVSETDEFSRNTFYVYDGNDHVVHLMRELVTMVGRFSLANVPTVRDNPANPTYILEDYAYDVTGARVSKVDALGTQQTKRYDNLGREIEVVEAAGTSIASKSQYLYDPAGNNIKVIHPRTFTNEGNNLDSFRDEMTYTGRNLLATRTEMVGRPEQAVTERNTFTLTGQKATAADANGNVTTFKYDVNDRLSEEDDAAGFAVKFAYDANGNKTAVTDQLNHTTTVAYDGRNRPVKKTLPAGEVTTTDYDDNLTDGAGIDATGVAAGLFTPGIADGYAVRTTTAAGVVFISLRDGFGRVVREQKGTGSTVQRITTNQDLLSAQTPQRSYSLAQTAVTDPLGNVTLFDRDRTSAIREVDDAEGKVTTAVVNAIGKSLSERDPTNVGFDCTYDAMGREVSCTDTQGSTNTTSYDVESNVLTKTNGLGKVDTSQYDGRSRRVTDIDEMGRFTRYFYDGLSNTTRMLDNEGKDTFYQYDNRGLRTKTTYTDGGVVTASFTGTRKLGSVTNQLNQTVTYNYDADDRLASRAYPDGLNDTFSYDGDSRLTSAKSNRYNNTVSLAYDALNRQTSETVSVDGMNLTTQHAYDVADREVQETYPNGTALLKTYNKRHEITGLNFGGSSVASFTRDDAGRPVTTTLGNGLTETRTFRADELMGSVQLSNPSTGAVITKLAYSFDAAKRKTQEQNTVTPSETQNFTYDDDNRLINFSQGTNTQSWVLSPSGNWQNTVINGAVQNRAHDNAYAITAITTNVTVNLTNDANGRTTKDEKGTTYAWDFDNQIKSTTTSGGTVTSYTYDALSRRLSRSVGGVKTVFVNQGERGTDRVLSEYDNGTWKRSYVYGEFVDDVVMTQAGTARYFHTNNQNFSTQVITDASKNVVEKYRYDAYGQRTILSPSGTVLASSAIGNRVGYTGRVHEDSGLMYFRIRYYRPSLGRFISRDAEFFNGPNLYVAYFVPSAMDPSGQGWFHSLVHAVAKVAQKVVVKVDTAIKKAADVKIKVEGTGEGDAELSFCTGVLTLQAVFKYEVGVEATAFGAHTFLGVEGDFKSKPITYHPFDGLGCGGECDECCVAQAKVTVSIGSGGTVAPFWAALKQLEKKVGFECTIEYSNDNCKQTGGFECKANILELIPGINGIVKAINATHLAHVHAGLKGGGEAEWCRGKPSIPDNHYSGAYAFEDAKGKFGIFIEVGLGAEKEED